MSNVFLSKKQRAEAFKSIYPEFAKDPYKGSVIGRRVLQELGLKVDEAEVVIDELAEIIRTNALGGGITEFPYYDAEEPAGAFENQVSPIFEGFIYFARSYVEHCLGHRNYDAEYLGRMCLGNSLNETEELIKLFEIDPDSVSKFLRWSFGNDSSIEMLLNEFEQRLADGSWRQFPRTHSS